MFTCLFTDGSWPSVMSVFYYSDRFTDGSGASIMSSMKSELRNWDSLFAFSFSHLFSVLSSLWPQKRKSLTMPITHYAYSPTRLIKAMIAFHRHLPWGSLPESNCGSLSSWVVKVWVLSWRNVVVGSGSTGHRGGAFRCHYHTIEEER